MRSHYLLETPAESEHHILRFEDDYAHASLADVKTPLSHSAILTQLKLQTDGALKLGGRGQIKVHKEDGHVAETEVDKETAYGTEFEMKEKKKDGVTGTKPNQVIGFPFIHSNFFHSLIKS